MTPLKCFRISGLVIYTEDYVGTRRMACMCPTKEDLDWIIGSLLGFHTSTKALNFDDDNEYIRS